MVKVKGAMVVLLICATLMNGCAQMKYLDGAPKAVQDFYHTYIDASKIDHGEAIREYEYIGNEETREFLIDHYTGKQYTDSKILTWRQLSNSLWAVEESTTITNNGGETYTAWHFVCILDGEYKVVKNVWHVPSELQEGLDMTPYWPPGEPWVDYVPII